LSRAEQIDWWLGQIEAVRRTVEEDRQARRRPTAHRMHHTPASDVVIRGKTLTGALDEERRRALPSSSGGGSGQQSRPSPSTALPSPVAGSFEGNGGDRSGGSLARARQLAAGYQPAVVKVLSYASGSARATATSLYVQREDVPVETHDGKILSDREAVADEIKDWSKDFEKRKPSHDVLTIRLKLEGVKDTPEGRETYAKAIGAGFDGHRHASRVERLPSGELEAHIVTAAAGGPKERFRVRSERAGDERSDHRQLDYRSEAVMKARIDAATNIPPTEISLVPGKPQHGRDGVVWQLNRLISQRGPLSDERGNTIGDAAVARNTAKDWNRSLRSQSPRDTMHLMLSSKSGVDPEALRRAARAFLHDRFADHRFLFGMHVDREGDGHIHVHAVITVKSETGQKMHPGPSAFRSWRESYAEHAQAEGLKIVATSAMERASQQSYGPRDKAIVDVAERPRPQRSPRDSTYAAGNQRRISDARRRIELARANPIRIPMSASEQRVLKHSADAWNTVAREQPENPIANAMLERVSLAQTVGAILLTIGQRVQHLTRETTDMPITAEKMARDLRLMNEAISNTSDLLEGETKKQFREASARYLETLATRLDLQRASEAGVQHLSRSEVHAIAGIDADRLIARAQEVRIGQEREAASAERQADRATALPQDEKTSRGRDPVASHPRTSEAALRSPQRMAVREAPEAEAAKDAARSITEHPAQSLPAALIQTEGIARLRAEQEKLVREVETERQSQKGQRQT